MASTFARRLTMLGTVVGIAAGLVAVYQGLKPSPPSPIAVVHGPDATTSKKTFTERAAGSYSLSSWTEAGGPITLGVRMTEGTLQIDSSGVADWSVVVEQAHSPDPGRVRMTAEVGFFRTATKSREFLKVSSIRTSISTANGDKYLSSYVRPCVGGAPASRKTGLRSRSTTSRIT